MELGARNFKREKPKQFQGPSFKPKGNFVKKNDILKESQTKGETNGKPKGTFFNCNEMRHYSKDYPKPILNNVGPKVIAPIADLVQGEHNRFIFLKGHIPKWEVLCLLDTWTSHNFITPNSAKKMELQLEKLKAPIQVHFANGVPHPIMLQARDMPLQLGNWR
jgi:hypothetical protein